MKRAPARANGGARTPLHLPSVPRPVPYWARLVPPGELPPRAVMVRLVLALVLATGLWIGVSNAQDPVRIVRYDAVPVQVLSPTGYYPMQQAGPVTVIAEGLSSDFKDAPRPLAFADVKHVALGVAQRVRVRVGGLPPDVQVQSVLPTEVSLRLETKASKIERVIGQVINAPPGYVVSQPIITPPTVKVTGPSHTVAAVREARVVVDASGLRNDRVLSLDPAVYDVNGQQISRKIILIQPPSVSVAVRVSLQQYRALVPVEAAITGTVATGYRISGVTVFPPLVPVVSNAPIPSTLVLKTQPISVAGLAVSHSEPSVPLVVPPNLTLQHPVQESVAIEVVPVPGSAVSTAQLLVQGRRRGTTVSLDTGSVTVEYQGPIPLLNAAGAPRAVLDLRNRPPGVYHLRPTIVLARGLSLVRVSPSQVQVLITAPPQPHPTATPRPRPTATARPRPTATARPRPTATPRPAATATPQPRRTATAPRPRIVVGR